MLIVTGEFFFFEIVPIGYEFYAYLKLQTSLSDQMPPPPPQQKRDQMKKWDLA
jgi:hypothetical protein